MKKTVSFQIDEELLEKLDEAATVGRDNRSALLRQLIENLLEGQSPKGMEQSAAEPKASTALLAAHQ
jgi:metal-responsive CopG/Arc/MetJ family transcriptional regulator